MSVHNSNEAELTARLLEAQKDLASAERLAVAMAGQVKQLCETNQELTRVVEQLMAERKRAR
jgi:hypothetical protein